METVKDLYALLKSEKLVEKAVSVQGWVKTNRNNGTIGFIELNDGSAFKSIQIVYEKVWSF